MERILCSGVSRVAFPQSFWISLHLGSERPLMTRCALIWNLGNPRKHECPVILHSEHRPTTTTNDTVIFPVSESCSVRDSFGSNVNTDPILQCETLLSSCTLLPSFPMSFPLIWNTIFSISVVNPRVNCFVAYRRFSKNLWWKSLHLSGDLFWRKPCMNLISNIFL